MTRYLIAANFWLVLALILSLGRTYERSQPDRYSFFHSGYWFAPDTYSLLNFAVFAVAVIYLILMWKTRSKP